MWNKARDGVDLPWTSLGSENQGLALLCSFCCWRRGRPCGQCAVINIADLSEGTAVGELLSVAWRRLSVSTRNVDYGSYSALESNRSQLKVSYGHGERLCSNSRQGKVNTKPNVSGSLRWVGKHYCHHKNPSWKGKIKWRSVKPVPQQAFCFWAGGCSHDLLTELTESLCAGPLPSSPWITGVIAHG